MRHLLKERTFNLGIVFPLLPIAVAGCAYLFLCAISIPPFACEVGGVLAWFISYGSLLFGDD